MQHRNSFVWLLSLFLTTLMACGGSDATLAVDPNPTAGTCDDDFESTFEAIQTVLFVNQGCTVSACHGSAAVGGLDLRADAAYAALLADALSSPDAHIVVTRHPLFAALSPGLAALVFCLGTGTPSTPSRRKESEESCTPEVYRSD